MSKFNKVALAAVQTAQKYALYLSTDIFEIFEKSDFFRFLSNISYYFNVYEIFILQNSKL